MAQIPIPKANTVPIAITLGGVTVIAVTLFGLFFGSNDISPITIFVFVLLGLILMIVGLAAWYWDRQCVAETKRYEARWGCYTEYRTEKKCYIGF
jgi:hypothetical protein